jgi:hypothetical protein
MSYSWFDLGIPCPDPGFGIASEVGTVSSAKTKPRDPKTNEPCFFHGKGIAPYEEMFHMLGGKRSILHVVDLTTGDGGVAHWCCQNRISYTGFVFTEMHATKLKAHLQDQIFTDMKTEGNVLYKNGLATLLDTIQVEEGNPDDPEKKADPPKAGGKSKPKANGKGKGKAKPKDKAKPKGKAKGKKAGKAITTAKRKGAPAGNDDEEEEEDDDEGEEEEASDSASEDH